VIRWEIMTANAIVILFWLPSCNVALFSGQRTAGRQLQSQNVRHKQGINRTTPIAAFVTTDIL
jgi:hypothetical protein